jgi:hypothetical protein
MNKQEFDAFVKSVDDKLGNLQMVWEGPEPHDFRNMEERGVRFVHSSLYYPMAGVSLFRLPDGRFGSRKVEVEDYAPEGKVQFKVLVGDEGAAAKIRWAIKAAGFTYTEGEAGAPYWPIMFEVQV